MGWSLSKGFWGYQRVTHQSSGLGSSHFEKIILDLCASYGPLFRHSFGTKEQWRLWILHLLLEQNSNWSRISINPIEKEFLAFVFVIQKIWHYLVGQTIHIISRDNPLRILMTKPRFLNSKLANWAILLIQYDITFVPQKAFKGQALTDFLAAHLVQKTSKLHTDITHTHTCTYIYTYTNIHITRPHILHANTRYIHTHSCTYPHTHMHSRTHILNTQANN